MNRCLWRFALLTCFSTCLDARQSNAAEPAAVSLFDRDSLTGWDYGPTPTRGWRMSDGVLIGVQGSTPLVSGWSWNDVELTFRWRVSDGAVWHMALRRLPEGETFAEVILREIKPDPAQDGERRREESASVGAKFPGASSDRPARLEVDVGPIDGGWHQTTLRRAGNQLAVTIGKSKAAVKVPEGQFALELRLAQGTGFIDDLKATEPIGKPLYNGHDLTGWWTPGNLASWKPEGDAIVCVNDNGNYLRTEQEYANFTLSLEYKMAKGGNSGVGIRTARSGWPSGDGMELQMLDEPKGAPISRHSTMAIYGNLEPLARADRSQEWNRVVIKAEGYIVSAWVNGVLVQHANTAELPELRRRNLKGWIGLQDHGARTEFRELHVLEAPDGLGLKAWQTPRPRSGSQLVLERLMNPECLAIDDGLGAGAVAATVDDKSEQVLAELKGPAAVVIVSRTNQSGKLAFYFDGESTPRLECAADKLHEHLPLVGQDTQPLLTYLAYRKSLKATIKDATPVDYRLDYVTFPDDVPLEDFVDGRTCVARGLLPALSYRNEQLGWGTHREADPLPRAGGESRTIDEQNQATLVDLKGPGIVEWTKLIAAPSLLADDDLWLEVTVDDEPEPAVAAPARYFFPGLAAGNYPNYLVLNRNGWTNMLAMPFGSRLTIAVANHGRRPVSPVGVMVSYQPLTDAGDPRLACRLRGWFETEAKPSDRSWVKQSGSGRFVGLVTQYGKIGAGVESLIIDGQGQDGWHSPDWRTVLGFGPKATDERHSLTGRQGGFQWRFFLLAPPAFHESFRLRAPDGPPLGNRLALFYLQGR